MKACGGEIVVLFSVWFSLPVTFLPLRAAIAQGPAPPPAPLGVTLTDAGALASEGRRLMNDGRWASAKEKLERATADPKADSEWVFDLGHCLMRMGKDDEALKAFRKYLTLPLTLRAAEAERRIAAIEGSQS